MVDVYLETFIDIMSKERNIFDKAQLYWRLYSLCIETELKMVRMDRHNHVYIFRTYFFNKNYYLFDALNIFAQEGADVCTVCKVVTRIKDESYE